MLWLINLFENFPQLLVTALDVRLATLFATFTLLSKTQKAARTIATVSPTMSRYKESEKQNYQNQGLRRLGDLRKHCYMA